MPLRTAVATRTSVRVPALICKTREKSRSVGRFGEVASLRLARSVGIAQKRLKPPNPMATTTSASFTRSTAPHCEPTKRVEEGEAEQTLATPVAMMRTSAAVAKEESDATQTAQSPRAAGVLGVSRSATKAPSSATPTHRQASNRCNQSTATFNVKSPWSAACDTMLREKANTAVAGAAAQAPSAFQPASTRPQLPTPHCPRATHARNG